MLDFGTHRQDSKGSGMLSTTTSEKVAHNFTDPTSDVFSPHVYILRAKYAIDPGLGARV